MPSPVPDSKTNSSADTHFPVHIQPCTQAAETPQTSGSWLPCAAPVCNPPNAPAGIATPFLGCPSAQLTSRGARRESEWVCGPGWFAGQQAGLNGFLVFCGGIGWVGCFGWETLEGWVLGVRQPWARGAKVVGCVFLAHWAFGGAGGNVEGNGAEKQVWTLDARMPGTCVFSPCWAFWGGRDCSGCAQQRGLPA